MTDYNAGTARATYAVSFEQFRRDAEQIRRIWRELEQQQARITRSTAPTVRGTPAAAAAATRAARETAQAQDQAAAAAARRQREEADLARALAQAARAEQQRQTEAARTAKAQEDAAAAAARRAAAEQRAARQAQNGGLGPALPRTFAGFTPGGFAQAAGAFGLATAGPAVVGAGIAAGVDAGRQSLALRQTLNLTRELSGTQATYNQVLAAARQQQELYGGSLQENIQGLSGLVVSARSSGAELETLINLSQRLAVLDPAQGAEGARIALSEVLAGDPASLARRYEIPRSALEKIKDESLSTSERLAVLDQYLEKIGITSAIAGATITEQAKAYNRLGAEIDTLTTNIGGGLADAFTPAATGLERLIGLINRNPEAIAELKALLSGKGAVTGEDLARTAETVARNQAEASLGGGSGGVADRLGGFEAYQDVVDRITELVKVGPEAAQVATDLGTAFALGEADAAALGSRLSDLEAQYGILNEQQVLAITRGTGVATGLQEQTAATAALTEEQRKQILAQTESAAEGQRLADVQAFIARIGGQVQAGMITAAEGASILANRYGFAADEADRLAAASARAAQRTITQAVSDQRAGERNIAPAALRVQADRQREIEREREQARRDQILATGSATQVVTQRQRELNEAIRQYGAGSAEAIRAETALIEARRRSEKAAASSGAAATRAATQQQREAEKRANAAEKEAEQQLDIQRDFERKAIDAQRDFEKKKFDIQKDFAERRRRANQDFSDQQFEDELSFYESLRGIQDQAVAQQASAEFERFRQEAAGIRDTQGADRAAEFEGKATEVAAARARRAAKLAEQEQAIREEEDGKRRAQLEAQLQYDRDLDAKRRELEERQLDRIRNGETGESIDQQEQQALADAEAARDATIASAAEAAGLRIVDAETKKLEAAQLTNQALLEQLRLQQALGGLPPTAPAGPAAPLRDAMIPIAPPPPGAAAPPAPAPLTIEGVPQLLQETSALRADLAKIFGADVITRLDTLADVGRGTTTAVRDLQAGGLA